ATRRFLGAEFGGNPSRTYRLLYAPGEAEAANVPDAFFQVPLSRSFEDRLPYLVFPPTDTRPFFRDLRKHLHPLESDAAGYIPDSTARFINKSLLRFVPRDRIHLYLLGALSIVMSVVIVGLPLGWMRRQGLRGPVALPALGYFGCLGAGFIVIEVVLISKFAVLIGFPIYAMATVISSILVAAGIGSAASTRVPRRGERSAMWVFPTLAALIGGIVVAFPLARDFALSLSQGPRIVLA